jgi:general secretion pathway protein D
MSSGPAADRRGRRARPAACRLFAALALAALAAACASSGALRNGQRAERLEDYDLAVVEYTKAVRAAPDSLEARQALERAKLRAADAHFFRARRLTASQKYDEALLEYQIAAELNPASGDIARELKATRNSLRAQLASTSRGQTRLQALIARTRDLPPEGLELPSALKLPSTLQTSAHASSRDVFTLLAKLADVNIVFDPAFRDEPVSIDLHDSTFGEALSALASSTHNFYRVTAPRTITIVPDTPAKRREYEQEIVRTFYLSNADLKETMDLLRIVIDARRIAPVTATNAITIKDTPERIAATAKVISAIDKARPEVVIDVELLEVNRSKLKEYGLQAASPNASPTGVSGQASVNRSGLTLRDLTNLTQADVLMTGLPDLYYRLLKNDTATRVLANPHLRTSEGIPAEAHFGERVPVPVTTFAPIATGGVNQQPITSYNYENIGVNIDITPRTHHDDDVSLALKVDISSISGTGYGGLPTFGNRSISTTIRLKDGETNMLAGLIRDDERKVLSGIPGLSDIPVLGRLFAYNHIESQETDIILTLTPHIVRVLDLTEADLRPFRVDSDLGVPIGDLPAASPVEKKGPGGR